jgi:hypothetical protein
MAIKLSTKSGRDLHVFVPKSVIFGSSGKFHTSFYEFLSCVGSVDVKVL